MHTEHLYFIHSMFAMHEYAYYARSIFALSGRARARCAITLATTWGLARSDSFIQRSRRRRRRLRSDTDFHSRLGI